MKTSEELQALQQEYASLSEKLKNLSEDELKQVTGGTIDLSYGLVVGGGATVGLTGERCGAVLTGERCGAVITGSAMDKVDLVIDQKAAYGPDSKLTSDRPTCEMIDSVKV